MKGLELKPNEVVGQSVFNLYSQQPNIINSIKKSLLGTPSRFEAHIGEFYFDNYVVPVSSAASGLKGVVGVALDISEGKLAQATIKDNEIIFQNLFTHMNEGFAFHELIYDSDNKALDYRILDVNISFEKQTGIPQDKAIGALATDLYGISPAPYLNIYEKVVQTGKGVNFQTYFAPLDRHFGISVFSPKPGYFATVFTDNTERILIKEKADHLAEIVKFSDDAIIRKDLENKITSWNKGAENIYGYTESEVIGKHISILIPNRKKDEVERIKKEILSNKLISHFETVRMKKDGTEINISLTVSPIYDNNGKIIAISSIARDITERKIAETALQKSESDLRRAQSVAHIGSWELDIGKNRLTCTSETFRILGLMPDSELSFELILSCVHPDDVDRVNNNFRNLTKKEKTSFEHRILVNKEVKWINEICELEMYKKDNPARIIGTVQDITLQKKADEKIHLLNAELENRIEYRTRQLKEANEELEAFVYSVSHDLRAPLRSINGFAEILKADYEDKVDEEGRRVIGTITRNAIRMGQLIDDLLQFSRMGRSQMSSTIFDTQKIVEEIVKELTSAGNKNKLRINVNRLHACRGDLSMIRQVWVNLISNAIKYSQKKDIPQIEIGSNLLENEYVYFVKDNGTGFDMKYANKLFKVFQRLHTSNEFEGTGIGLALSKRIISRHGGRIWAEAKPDHGATFYFSLPAA